MLSDVVMPGMSGPELANNLIPLRPEMKLLYMSGYTSPSIVRRGLLDSPASILQKPFTRATLLGRARAALESEKVSKPQPIRLS
jgi:FixJ family two-component response regulator